MNQACWTFWSFDTSRSEDPQGHKSPNKQRDDILWQLLCNLCWIRVGITAQPLVFSRTFADISSTCRGCVFALDHTQTHTTVGRTPLDKGLACRRDIYLTTQTLTRDKHPCPPVGFEPTNPASTQPQTYALDHVATGIGYTVVTWSCLWTVVVLSCL
jgi:hypothetical protein